MRDSKSGVCNIGVRICYEDNVGIVGAYGWIGRLDSHVSRSFGYNEYERLISLGVFLPHVLQGVRAVLRESRQWQGRTFRAAIRSNLSLPPIQCNRHFSQL